MHSISLNHTKKIAILLIVVIIAIVAVLQLKPISQDPAYHQFADRRTIFGVPDFWNVVTNFGFIAVGIWGLVLVVRSTGKFLKIAFITLFIGILLTGIGSAYYHLDPDNDRLVYDRIPMTIVFMAFLSAAIQLCISRTWGMILLFPLLGVGIGSVVWWHYSESMGTGDLRYYALVQFLPIILVPLIFLLFSSPKNKNIWPLFGWIIGWYILAKLLERYDAEILRIGNAISGHSLKHIAATIATVYFIGLFKASGTTMIQNDIAVLK